MCCNIYSEFGQTGQIAIINEAEFSVSVEEAVGYAADCIVITQSAVRYVADFTVKFLDDLVKLGILR